MTGGALSQQISSIDTACCVQRVGLGGKKLKHDCSERRAFKVYADVYGVP